MHPLHAFKILTHSCCGLLLLLAIGFALPSDALAQEQGGGTTNPSPSVVQQVINIFRGNTGANGGGTGNGTGSGGSVSPGSVQGSGGWGGSTVDTALDQGGNAVNGFLDMLTDFGHSPVGQFFSDLFAPGVDATRDVVDTVINGAVGAGVEVSNWVFRSNTTNPGTPANNGDLSVPSMPSGMTNVITTYDSAGNPTYHVTTYDAQGYAIGTVSYDSHGNPIETVIYDNEGNPVTVPNAARPSGGGSGPSIPGASKGTVGNPFSDGTDKNDAKSSNEEDTSNPYLFEYDPSSTNNNPSGSGAQDR